MENQYLRVNHPIDLIHLLENKKDKFGTILSNLKSYEKRASIYNCGDPANELFFIKKGRVKIENDLGNGRAIIKNVFMKGELFGEASLLGQAYRIDFATAMEKTELYLFSPEALSRQMQNSHHLTTSIIKLLGKRLIATEQKVESFVFKNSRTRVIDFLMDLVHKRGQRIGYEILVRQFFTHQEIANITATSRQTVTTVLNELRDKKLLTCNKKRLLIRDIDLLRAEAP